MSLVRCPSCGFGNAAEAKYCSDCGGQLHLPPHLASCPHCGAINPATGTVCLWCHRKLYVSLWRRLRRPTRVVVAAMATSVVAVAALGYYVFHREDAPRAPAAIPATSAQEASPEPGRAERQPGEASRAKAAPAAVAQPQASNSRKAAERADETCTEASAALGFCGKTQPRQPPPPQVCTEAVAALGLCDARNIQGRE